MNWRELTAPPVEPLPPSPPPPVNWRERTGAPAVEPPPPSPPFSAPIVPERDPDLHPRKMGFFERLGFGRSRRD